MSDASRSAENVCASLTPEEEAALARAIAQAKSGQVVRQDEMEARFARRWRTSDTSYEGEDA